MSSPWIAERCLDVCLHMILRWNQQQTRWAWRRRFWGKLPRTWSGLSYFMNGGGLKRRMEADRKGGKRRQLTDLTSWEQGHDTSCFADVNFISRLTYERVTDLSDVGGCSEDPWLTFFGFMASGLATSAGLNCLLYGLLNTVCKPLHLTRLLNMHSRRH